MPVVHHRDRPIIHSASGEPSLSMVVNREVGATALSVWVKINPEKAKTSESGNRSL